MGASSEVNMPEPSVSEVMAMLDHSLLKPTLTLAELTRGCQDARSLQVASVCILPHFLERSLELLADSATLPSSVLAFPHGALSLTQKLGELECLLRAGAKEVDAVINLSHVKSHAFDRVEREICELTSRAHADGVRIKIIFETCCLTDLEKSTLCAICGRAAVDWVKTSTGFGSHGATPQDVQLMRRYTPASVQVKASGGIRTLEAVLGYRKLGASRVGTSASRAIFEEAVARLAR